MFFGLAALSILMSAIDGTMVAVALPSLIADLDASLTWVGWTLTAYALAQTVMLPMAGKLAEQLGAMRVFLASVALFTVGSLLCGLAPNVYALAACRVIQAIGGGGFFPAATGIVAQQFPESRGRMIGLFASIFPTGAILGPNLGGLVIEQLGWRNVFFINVPLGLLIVALLVRAALAERPAPPVARVAPASSPSSASRAATATSVPSASSAASKAAAPVVSAPAEQSPPGQLPPGQSPPSRTRRRSIDALGALLFTLMMVGLLVALSMLGSDPSLIGSPVFWGILAGSGVLLVLFARQERRAPDPLLDLDLVVRRPFSIVNVFNVLSGACFMGFFSFIPYYATVQYGMGPLESGAILTPRSLVMIVTSTTTSFVLHRIGYRRPMLAGMLCVTGALLLLGRGIEGLSVGPLETGPLVPLLLIMALSGFGMGMLIPSSNNAGLDLLPTRAAVISGVRGLFHSTGGVLGTALIVLWLELSPDKAAGMRAVFAGLGLVLLVTTPLVFLIPDKAWERRQAARR